MTKAATAAAALSFILMQRFMPPKLQKISEPHTLPAPKIALSPPNSPPGRFWAGAGCGGEDKFWQQSLNIFVTLLLFRKKCIFFALQILTGMCAPTYPGVVRIPKLFDRL
ncbi:MAG: hypothetical protein SOT19_06145 [Muribaculaceae bacterium]|nr:hypothetical protein [Muribaculaceae bacterium]